MSPAADSTGESACGPVVAVGVRQADRGHRSPEQLVVLDLEAADVAVGHGHVEQTEQPRVVPEIHLPALAGDRAGDGVPLVRRTADPEQRDLGLSRCVRRVLAGPPPPRALDLVEVIGVLPTAQPVRPRGCELVAAAQDERVHRSPFRQERELVHITPSALGVYRQTPGRVACGNRLRRRRDLRRCIVVIPLVLNCRCRRLTQRLAGCHRRGIRDARQHCGVSTFGGAQGRTTGESHFQHIPRRGRDGRDRRRVRAQPGGPVLVRRGLDADGVHRVMNRDVHHCVHPGFDGRGARHSAGDGGAGRRLVPSQHSVRLTLAGRVVSTVGDRGAGDRQHCGGDQRRHQE